MNFIYDFISEELTRAIGWTLFHSLWQGIVIAILLALVLLLTSAENARLRYNLSISAMFLMFFCSVITFTKVYNTTEKNDSAGINFVSSYQTISVESSEDVSFISSDTKFELAKTFKSFFAKNLPLIVTIWLAGFLIFSLRFTGGLIYAQRLRTTGINHLDEIWFLRLKSLSEEIGFKKAVQIFESTKVKVPVAIGYLKPVILLPLGMIIGLPQNQVEAIIIHELAHLKRNDFIINLIQTFIETIFFFHPVIWWISSMINNERENCCDDLAITISGDSLAYSKALYNLQQIHVNENELILAAVGKKNQLFRRINRMNTKNKNRSYGAKFATFAVLLFIIAAVSIYSTSSAKENQRNVTTASFVNPLLSANEKISFSSPVSELTATPDTSSIKKGKHTLKFTDDKKRFKAKLNNGKLEELYVDGEQVPEKDLEKYSSKVVQQADEYDSAMKEYRANMQQFKENMKSFKEKMKKFKGNYSFNYDYDFDFDIPPVPPIAFDPQHFDTTEWKKIMKDVQKNIHESFANHSLKIPPVHIPPIHIPPIDVDLFRNAVGDSTFDKEAFKESMKEWKENFSKEMEKWKVDMKDFKVDMEKFKEEMKKNGPNSEAFKKNMAELKTNMDKLKVDMKILKEFLNDVKKELVKDKLMDEGDNLNNFTLSKDEMIVGGKKVSPELHKKYLGIYKKHYGKELTGDHKINFND